mgnify:CR=1 FL=1
MNTQKQDANGNRLCEHGHIFDTCRECVKAEQEMHDRRETIRDYVDEKKR